MQQPGMMMHQQPAANRYRRVFFDLEMTGLDPSHHLMLEVAMVITDWPGLNVLYTYHRYVRREYADETIMTPFARRTFCGPPGTVMPGTVMHACVTMGVTEPVIDMEMASVLDMHRGGRPLILCGSSVHTDRAFIQAFLPHTYARLHYQHVDVTSVLQVMRAWCPHVLEMSDMPVKNQNHSALVDVMDSLKLLRFFKTVLGTVGHRARIRRPTVAAFRRPRARPQTPVQVLVTVAFLAALQALQTRGVVARSSSLGETPLAATPRLPLQPPAPASTTAAGCGGLLEAV
jgi:oligoribonuclease